MIILQFFHISTKGCLGGDHKHMSLDFRDQTGPLLRTVAFLKLGFGFFLPTSVQNLDPSDNFSIVPKKKNSSELIFQQTWTQNGRFGFQLSLGGSGGRGVRKYNVNGTSLKSYPASRGYIFAV